MQGIAGNTVCADCTTSDPRHYPALPTWASANLGVVFCIRCCGIHRKLGAHISKVLSLQIDSWTHIQLLHMRSTGNAAVNATLEATLGAGIKPDQAHCTTAELEAFIRAKYVMGSFMKGGDGTLPAIESTKHEDDNTQGLKQKAMAEYCGLLIIRLLRADNLPNMDLVTKTDAFCVFTLGERKATSRTVRNSLNPAWNETLSLNVRSLSESLILKVFDRDLLSSGYIGQALVPLQDLPLGQPMGFDLTITQPVERRGHKGQATVALELTYNPLDR